MVNVYYSLLHRPPFVNASIFGHKPTKSQSGHNPADDQWSEAGLFQPMGRRRTVLIDQWKALVSLFQPIVRYWSDFFNQSEEKVIIINNKIIRSKFYTIKQLRKK